MTTTRFWIETVDARARSFITGWRYVGPSELSSDITKFSTDRAEIFQLVISSVAKWLDENPNNDMCGGSFVLEARGRLTLLDYNLIRLCCGKESKGLHRDSGPIRFIRGELDKFLKRDSAVLDELFIAIQELMSYNVKYGESLDLSELSSLHDELWAHALMEGAVNA